MQPRCTAAVGFRPRRERARGGDGMKALAYVGERASEIRDVADAAAADGEAVVSVEAAGICGSDMHAWMGHDPRRRAPLVLGHEVAGVVSGGALDGRRVALNPLISCGSCPACAAGRTNLCSRRGMIGMSRPGGFAERVSIPERNLIEIPPGLDSLRASLMEPCACAWHAASLLARASRQPTAACNALVVGGGAIGLLSGLVLRAWGAADVVVAETNPLRRETVSAAGLPARHPTDGIPSGGFDLVVDAVGSVRSRALAIGSVRAGGAVAHLGLQEDAGEFDARRLTLAEVAWLGVYTYVEADLRASLVALADGRMGALDWIEARPLDAGPQAFRDIAEGAAAAPKVVLVP